MCFRFPSLENANVNDFWKRNEERHKTKVLFCTVSIHIYPAHSPETDVLMRRHAFIALSDRKNIYTNILMPLKYHVFENIMENGAFAPKEQMLHFP